MKTRTRSPSRPPKLLKSPSPAPANVMLPNQHRVNLVVEQQEVIGADAVHVEVDLPGTTKVR